MMSAPMLFWMAIECSGVRFVSFPSCGDMNQTPSSVMRASFSSETIWKPPLSVSVPVPVLELVQPADGVEHLGARAQVQVVRVAEDDRRVERVELARGQPLDGALRPHGHEDRRGDGPVGQHDGRRAREPGGALRVERELERPFYLLLFVLLFCHLVAIAVIAVGHVSASMQK